MQVSELGGENLGIYMKVTDDGVTTKCELDSQTGLIACEEDSYTEVAYLRFTESVLNTAVISPVDEQGRPLAIFRQFIESSSSDAWFVQLAASRHLPVRE